MWKPPRCSTKLVGIIDTDKLEKLRTEDDKAIQIDTFIHPDALDPVYYAGKSYYLAPDGPVGQKPYAVLYQAMEQEKRQAIARMHGKEQLVPLRPLDGPDHYDDIVPRAYRHVALYNQPMATRACKALAHRLPQFISPMLARPGTAFDSDEHLFEVKWDGTRTLAFVEGKQCRLLNRRRIDMADRYPEFACLAGFPAGTIVDGETVVLRDGKPDFTALLSREQARSPLKIRSLARGLPATYVVFDLLYERYRSVMELPLLERRRQLERLVTAAGLSQVVLSQGIIGPGRAFFQESCGLGLEGVVAKRLDSRYRSGKRSDAWLKIKRQLELCCMIIGFEPSGADDFRSLIIAIAEDGQLCCVGKVGTGFTERVRSHLNGLLWARLRDRPVVPCKLKGKWIEPDLFCRVVCMERTVGGELRAPAFKGLIDG